MILLGCVVAVRISPVVISVYGWMLGMVLVYYRLCALLCGGVATLRLLCLGLRICRWIRGDPSCILWYGPLLIRFLWIVRLKTSESAWTVRWVARLLLSPLCSVSTLCAWTDMVPTVLTRGDMRP